MFTPSGSGQAAVLPAARRNPFYPKSPHPKDAVHRMEKTTRTIIQISSFFMVNSSFVFRRLGLFHDDVGFLLGPIDLPRYLDRPQIVPREAGNRLIVDEFNRWGGSLEWFAAPARQAELETQIAEERRMLAYVESRLSRLDDGAFAEAGLVLRTALHAGEVVLRKGVCTGPVVITAARIVAVMDANVIAVTGAVLDELRAPAPVPVTALSGRLPDDLAGLGLRRLEWTGTVPAGQAAGDAEVPGPEPEGAGAPAAPSMPPAGAMPPAASTPPGRWRTWT